MRGDQLTRVLRLAHLLRGKGRTLQQLRAELGVTKRTIQRDLQVLEQTGFPITSEQRGRSVYWSVLYDPVADSALNLTQEERMALYFARGLMKPLAGTPFYDAIESAIAKIGAGISAPGHALLGQAGGFTGIAAFGAKDYSRCREVIAALTRAVQHHFTVTLRHATLQHKTAVEYRVDPYRLHYVQGGLYLVGLDHGKQDLRTFAVERIRKVELTRKRFPPPPPKMLDDLQASAFQLIQGEPQLVRVWFSAAQAPYVRERMWHPSQQIEEQKDGSVILLLRVASRWEVERWVNGWGGEAKVLE